MRRARRDRDGATRNTATRWPARLRSASTLVVLLATLPRASAEPQRRPDPASQRLAILQAEDARAEGAAMAPIYEGIRSSDAQLQRLAVRALGRLERPILIDTVLRLLDAEDWRVRREAINALGQLAVSGSGEARGNAAAVERARRALLERASREPDARVRGTVLRTLGRVPLEGQFGEGVRVLAGAASPAADPQVVLGAAQGLESLARRAADEARGSVEVIGALRRLVAAGVPAAERDLAARVRRLAMTALGTLTAADASTLEVALGDPDAQVRQQALAAVTEEHEGATEWIDRALDDESGLVRYEALRALARLERPNGCGPIERATADTSPHVALLALDLLGEGCSRSSSIDLLQAEALTVSELPDEDEWHRAAHAIVALAHSSKDAARGLLDRFTEHAIWQVRMYAARAAAELEAAPVLERLARDSHHNVREAAIRGLSRVVGRVADQFHLEALLQSDYQLIRTAAGLLEGSADRRVSGALLAALDRLTAERRDTSRDPRLAILDRLHELGSRRNAGVVRPYLEDFDPAVASRAAELLTLWTGQPHEAVTTRMYPDESVPLDAASQLLRATVEMRRRGTFVLELFPDEAPATVHRFAQRAREGYYDGLTFHRVVANFVIQGGSPGANEFAGDRRYMRDEVGLRSHLRGTVGISTRGRDTGDAQLFVNLVDNPRLDHNYTVFARVLEGLDVVDSIREGDTIARVTIADGP